MTTAERQVAEALERIGLDARDLTPGEDDIRKVAVRLQERLNELRRLAQAYQAMSAPIGGSREAIDRELALNRYLAELGE